MSQHLVSFFGPLNISLVRRSSKIRDGQFFSKIFRGTTMQFLWPLPKCLIGRESKFGTCNSRSQSSLLAKK